MPPAASENFLNHIRDIYLADSPQNDPVNLTKIPATCDAIDRVISREAQKTRNAVDALEATVTSAEIALQQLQPRILVSTAAAWAKTAEVAAEAHRQSRSMHEHNQRMLDAQQQASVESNEGQARLANLQHKVAQMAIENYQIRRQLKQTQSENEQLHTRCRELCQERESWEAKQHLHTAQLKKLFARIEELRATAGVDPDNTCPEAAASCLAPLEKTVAKLDCLLQMTDLASKRHRHRTLRILTRFVMSAGERRATQLKRRSFFAWRGLLYQTMHQLAATCRMGRTLQVWRGLLSERMQSLVQTMDQFKARHRVQRTLQAWHSLPSQRMDSWVSKLASKHHMHKTLQAWRNLPRKIMQHLACKLVAKHHMLNKLQAWRAQQSQGGAWRALSTRLVTRAPLTHTRRFRRMLGWHRHFVRARLRFFFVHWRETVRVQHYRLRRRSLASRRVDWLRAKHAWRVWSEDYAYGAQRTAQLAMLIFRQAILQVCTALGYVAPVSDADTVAWYYEAALETQACVGMHLSAHCTAILHQRMCGLGVQGGLAFDAAYRVLQWAQGGDLLVMVKRVVAMVYGEYGHVYRAVAAVGMQDALGGV